MLIELISAIPIYFGRFDYCWEVNWKYYQGIEISFDNIHFNKEPYIEICQTRDIEQMKFTVAHELWHFFWFQYLTDFERTIYWILFDYSWPFDFLREYSKTNKEEDFADTFATIYRGKDLWHRWRVFNLKLDYIKLLINRYVN